ncbi:restriction endonuclease-related protein [Sediminitomix flava]|uniref:REase associating with pPIWI RE domain-containing protein n=1 Tax=Sediminitomix flava TaxID=379075 RepID=A0A315YYW6_SEDFL|nr:hypothetical protein [Sediminitomix flava]PWJ34960.1 hypothetical protein BC781_1101 [Sediminitomix flava]
MDKLVLKLDATIGYLVIGINRMYKEKGSIYNFPYNAKSIYPKQLLKGFNSLLELCLIARVRPPNSLHELIFEWVEDWISKWPIFEIHEFEKEHYNYSILSNGILSEEAIEIVYEFSHVSAIEDELNTSSFIKELRASSQDQGMFEAYRIVRKWIIENPYMSEETYLKLITRFNKYEDLIRKAYQKVEKGITYNVCPNCHNIMNTYINERYQCDWIVCRRKDSGKKKPKEEKKVQFILKRAFKKFIQRPGLIELDLYDSLIDLGYNVELWPHLDTYDLKVTHSDSELAIDVKDWMNPKALAAQLIRPSTFLAPQIPFYILIPNHHRETSNYIGIVKKNNRPFFENSNNQIYFVNDFLKQLPSL